MAARIFICIVLPFAILWAFFSRMCREIGHGLHMARLDIRMEIEEARRSWRSGRLPGGEG